MKSNIVAVRYKGGTFAPLNPVAVAQKYKEGELYFFRPDNKRYWPGHQAFMALINDAWNTLPDHLQQNEFQTPDILRRRLLIAARFATFDTLICENGHEATIAARKITKYTDDHTFISIRGEIVVIAKAHSQRMDKMDADTFKASCKAATEELEKLLGCSREEIKAHAETLRSKKRETAWDAAIPQEGD